MQKHKKLWHYKCDIRRNKTNILFFLAETAVIEMSSNRWPWYMLCVQSELLYAYICGVCVCVWKNISAQFLPLFNFNLSQPQLNLISTKLQLNLSLNINLNLNHNSTSTQYGCDIKTAQSCSFCKWKLRASSNFLL